MKQNTEKQNTKDPSTIKPRLTQGGRIDLELIKKIMTEKKTTLPFQDVKNRRLWLKR